MNLSNLAKNLPINNLITKLSTKKGSLVTFDELKNELTRTNDKNEPIYHVKFKEDDDIAMVYYDDLPLTINTKEQLVPNIENLCRSYIFEKSTLLPITSQFNRIIYNDDTEEYLNKLDWKQVVIQPCYEGTMILLYHHGDGWYVSTRRCLDSTNSTWVKNKSYKEMFNEAIEGKIRLDDLDKNYCYHFILVYYKNRNIVSYSNLGDEYKEVYHAMTTEKYTLNEVEYNLGEKILIVDTLQFDNLENVMRSLLEISERDVKNTSISTEGYIFRVYEGELYKSPFTISKMQTPIYQKLMKMKPNNSNIYQSFLELYQKDQLSEFLPYFTPFANGGIQRYNKAMKTIAREILDLYHCTRNKNNPEIYDNLTDRYRNVLYSIHGIYIRHRNNDYKKKVTYTESYNVKKYVSMKSINVHDIYYHLKNLPAYELIQIFNDRMKLIENDKMIFIKKNCIYTKTVTRLMFGDRYSNK